VVVQETRVAELEAQREEQRLQASVRKPADAKAYEQVTLAKAERDARISGAEAQRQEVELQAAGNAQRVKLEADADAAQVRLKASAEAEHVRLDAAARAESTKAIGDAEASATHAKGLAEGHAVRARGMAEAEAIKARADALAQNQDAVIGQELAQNWPAIVEAAAKPFGGIDQLIVLNGAQGLSEVLAQALSQGVTGLRLARNLLAGEEVAGNGKPEPAETAP
jgi:flotillin